MSKKAACLERTACPAIEVMAAELPDGIEGGETAGRAPSLRVLGRPPLRDDTEVDVRLVDFESLVLIRRCLRPILPRRLLLPRSGRKRELWRGGVDVFKEGGPTLPDPARRRQSAFLSTDRASGEQPEQPRRGRHGRPSRWWRESSIKDEGEEGEWHTTQKGRPRGARAPAER